MPISEQVAAVRDAHWRHTGTASEAEVERICVDLLEQGIALEVLSDAMSRTPAALGRRAALDAASAHVHGDFVLPYVLHPAEGSRTLLVGFPGISIGPEPPGVGMLVGDQSHLHRLGLSLGAAPVQDIQQMLAWAAAAADLIRTSAASLEVPMSNVVCYGSSLQASRALAGGLKARAGYVVVGAPCIRAGTWTEVLWQGTPPEDPASRLFANQYKECRVAEDPTQIPALDALIPDLAAAATETLVHLLVSPHDIFWDECNEFRAALRRDQSGASCVLIEADYKTHAEVQLPLHVHVDRVAAHVERHA